MRRRAIEWLKTGLIVVLLISAVLLGYSSDVFTGLSGVFSQPGSASSDSGTLSAAPAEAARPGVIVLTNSYVQRAVFKYDMDAVDLIYERISSSVGEALGALSAPVECTEGEWRDALRSIGIMFEYHTYMPLELVRDWLGSSGDGYGISLRRLCLVFANNASALYFEDDDKFYVAQTTSLGGEFLTSATYENELKYQFEHDVNSPVPYMILTSGSTHTTAQSANPIAVNSALMDAVLSLGIDIRQISSYPDNDGTRFYVSGAFDLSVSSDGVINYRRTADNAEADFDLCSSVELARRTVASTIGVFSGEARVYYTGYTSADNSITVTFDYFFAGGRVFIPGHNCAAKVTVSGGAVTELTLCFKNYESDSDMVLLPESYALAISEGEFALGYNDSALTSPFWYQYDPRSTGGVS